MKLNLALTITALTFPVSALGTDWDAAYTPTRKEWIETAIRNDVARITDLWKTPIAVNVVVLNSDDAVLVLLANTGQTQISKQICSEYIKTARSIAEKRLSIYPWAQKSRIEVECVR